MLRSFIRPRRVHGTAGRRVEAALTGLALAAYIALFVALSGPFSRPGAEESAYWDRRGVAAWLCALASAFALPWSGAPLSIYAGAGSWLWFPSAAASFVLSRPDGHNYFTARKIFAAANIAAVVTAVCAFVSAAGVPGDIPGIEGLSAMSALESLAGGRLPLARALFFVSCVFSFAPAYNRGERAQAALSFSYSAFIVIVFLPPVHVFLKPLEPRGAILADAAEYAALSFAVHHFIMTPFSDYFAPRWKYGYLAVNAGITLAGIAFLFSAL